MQQHPHVHPVSRDPSCLLWRDPSCCSLQLRFASAFPSIAHCCLVKQAHMQLCRSNVGRQILAPKRAICTWQDSSKQAEGQTQRRNFTFWFALTTNTTIALPFCNCHTWIDLQKAKPCYARAVVKANTQLSHCFSHCLNFKTSLILSGSNSLTSTHITEKLFSASCHWVGSNWNWGSRIKLTPVGNVGKGISKQNSFSDGLQWAVCWCCSLGRRRPTEVSARALD